jgi:hypothetical protein
LTSSIFPPRPRPQPIFLHAPSFSSRSPRALPARCRT